VRGEEREDEHEEGGQHLRETSWENLSRVELAGDTAWFISRWFNVSMHASKETLKSIAVRSYAFSHVEHDYLMYLLAVNLHMFSLHKSPVIGWLLNGLERLGEEAAVAYCRNYFCICLERQRKEMKDISEESLFPGQDSNWTPPECKSEALPLESTSSANVSRKTVSWSI
jgi:hypothetical protein